MIPQPPLRVTDSFPQGSLGPYGAAGGHIGPPLPVYRGAKRRAVEDAGPYGGTTGSAMRWADVPKAWLRRPNFVPKFGRQSWSSAPTEERGHDSHVGPLGLLRVTGR